MHLKEWTLVKLLKLKGLAKTIFMYHVLNDRKCEDSNDDFSLQVKLASLGGSQQEELSVGWPQPLADPPE